MTSPNEQKQMIPAGRVQALLAQYESELERAGEDSPEGKVYKRVRRDLRLAIDGDD
jgi:hypothetical protein